MEEFIAYIVKNLVDDPEQVRARTRLEGDEVVITIDAAPADLGRVIGRRGKAIHAIRTLAGIVGARHNCRMRIDVRSEPGTE